MRQKIRKSVFRAFLLVLVMGFSSALARGQTKGGQTMESALDQSFYSMYNLQFDEALKKAEDAKSLAPDDPLPWVAQSCAVLFREFDRLHILRSETFASDEGFNSRSVQKWDPASKQQFEDALNGTEKIAIQRIARDKNDIKALFALALISGLRADDSALITKKNLAALGYTKTATAYAERLLALAPNEYDAYVATGMGKYIVGGKPAPVRWLLRLDGLKGDQQEGVKELTIAAEHGHYLAPFARILLAFDDLRHKNKTEARKRLALLGTQFPNNPLFFLELAKLDAGLANTGQ